MVSRTKTAAVAALVVALIILTGPSFSVAQDKGRDKTDSDVTTRVRIEVTGGDKSIPVEMASVYVRYNIKHRIGKDEKVEMNIKTNADGVAIAPYVPRRSVIVQVLADGWKPFGQTFEIGNEEQTIKIHLERPPKWY